MNSGKLRRNGSGPAPFLVKTHWMVEVENTNDIISWGEMGNSFVVWKPIEFARDLLPVHFKHNNFSSFVRQLNTYGFRKVVPDRWEFANDNFKRGEKSLLCKIRRRKAQTSPSSNTLKIKRQRTTCTNSTSNTNSSSSTSSTPAPTYVDLSNENEKLKNDNEALNKELSQAKVQCEELLGYLTKHVSKEDNIDATNLIKEAMSFGIDVKEDDDNEARNANEEMEEGKNEACLKLFGVLLSTKTNMSKKRRCEENNSREVNYWMKMNNHVGEKNEVCN